MHVQLFCQSTQNYPILKVNQPLIKSIRLISFDSARSILINLQFKGQKMNPNRNYKIFQPQSMQGRNANIAGSMLKKAQLTASKVSEKQELTPFSGYSYPTNQDSLATSQVSEFTQSQVQNFNANNVEFIRKMVKQQLERKMKEDKQKSDISIMKTEIKSLKQTFQQISKDFHQRFNDMHIQIKEQTEILTDTMMREHENQTRNNLKKVLSNMRQDMKKQFISYMGRQFIPLSFIDDLEKQLNQIEDRIQYVENKIRGNQNSSKSNTNPVILAETIELRMNKLDRQIDTLRKTSAQLPSKLKIHDQEIQNILKMTAQERQNSKFELSKIQSKLASYESQIRKIGMIDVFGQNLKLDIDYFKKKLDEFQKSKEDLYAKTAQLSKKSSDNIIQTNQLRQFLKNSTDLSNSVLVNSTSLSDQKDRPSSKQKIKNQLNPKESQITGVNIRKPSPGKNNIPIKISYTSPALNSPSGSQTTQINQNKAPSPQEIIKSTPLTVEQHVTTIGTASTQKQRSLSKSPEKLYSKSPSKDKQNGNEADVNKQAKTVYKIDGQGYLMDNDGKYLLDEYNRMILLSKEQIKTLQLSQLIEFV